MSGLKLNTKSNVLRRISRSSKNNSKRLRKKRKTQKLMPLPLNA